MIKCDIIIPVYNSYECVIDCIESIINNTVFDTTKLIIIDDKSTDTRIWPMLEEYSKKFNFINIYRNSKKLGFASTINKGIKLSTNDVILLNSDTEVTKNWLTKLIECAYSKENVATVTPLSNNSTLTSLLDFFNINDFPPDFSLQQISDLVENCSKNFFPEIPTGNSFCLYIKRTILDELGFFDEKSFNQGLCEEIDFCFRCLNKGYRHLLCDNTYIYHKECQLFSTSKYPLIQSISQVLTERYPAYCHKTYIWYEQKNLKYISDNIVLNLSTITKKPNILCIIHDWDINCLGGTTLHLYDLIRNLKQYYNFHIFTFENMNYKLYSYWSNYETSITYPPIETFAPLNFYNTTWKNIVAKIIEDFNIDLIHIHHLFRHYLDIPEIIKEKKIPTILSVHDFYSLCPLINKLYKNKSYCANYDGSKCNECLQSTLNLEQNTITNWRSSWIKLFDVCNKIICPSNTCKVEFEKTYPNLNSIVIEHGIDLIPQESMLKINPKEVLNIAFIGAVSFHKGGAILKELVTKYKSKEVKIHLFGICFENLPENSEYFKNHGPYNREDLPRLLKENNIKLICLLSIWPETFLYTLSESTACGIPVLGFNFGAMSERTTKYNLGWIIDKNSSSEDIFNKILEIKSNDYEYKNKIDSINKYVSKTTQEMSIEYNKIYSKYISKPINNNINIENIYKKIQSSINYTLPTSYTNYLRSFKTKIWKLNSKLKIKKIVKKLYYFLKKIKHKLHL